MCGVRLMVTHTSRRVPNLEAQETILDHFWVRMTRVTYFPIVLTRMDRWEFRVNSLLSGQRNWKCVLSFTCLVAGPASTGFRNLTPGRDLAGRPHSGCAPQRCLHPSYIMSNRSYVSFFVNRQKCSLMFCAFVIFFSWVSHRTAKLRDLWIQSNISFST